VAPSFILPSLLYLGKRIPKGRSDLLSPDFPISADDPKLTLSSWFFTCLSILLANIRECVESLNLEEQGYRIAFISSPFFGRDSLCFLSMASPEGFYSPGSAQTFLAQSFFQRRLPFLNSGPVFSS